ncbi:MAG TPA: alpha/beta hydrolase [Candidatus Dormibacteraeota bacterium]|nr:alpha/beta hydrolase [Candidatus Dormibacteraeota bacterium]
MKSNTPYGSTSIYSQKPSGSSERILVVPGFGESVSHIKPLVKALTVEGYETFTFRPPRRAVKENGKHIDPIMRQGKVILEILRSLLSEGEKIHVLAHSLGAAAVLKAVQLRPDYFTSLILMQPAGLVGEQSAYELAGRATKKAFSNHRVARISENSSTTRVLKSHLVSGGVIAKQPLLARREAVAAGRYNIQDDLQSVAALDIPVHVVVSTGDEMFDHTSVARSRSVIEPIVQSYTVLDEPTSNHDTFWIHPTTTAKVS